MILAFLLLHGAPGVFQKAVAVAVKGPSTAQIRFDPVEAALAAGQPVETRDWKPLLADKDGWFADPILGSGLVAIPVTEAADATFLLEAQGASMAYVNGEPRVGDVYSSGYVSLPIRLHKGENLLLFRVARGRLKVALVDPPKPISLDTRDATLPDRVQGHREPVWAALVVRNATDGAQEDLAIEATSGRGRLRTSVGPVLAMGIRKAGFRIPENPSEAVTVRLLRAGREIDRTELKLRVRKPTETRKRTFVSRLDGSVQYYAENPSSRPDARALVLSLHGAGVEAIGQAEAYASKSWANIIVPTNRRPYGFDWEDWGRLDALEVLDRALAEYRPDPARVYLTGHSMGGHGTWQVGTLYPDRFGAIAPSAGWISSFGYAGVKRDDSPDPLRALVARAGNVGDTAAMVHNLGALGVYILHGDADDNVPITEARTMAATLATFHHDFTLKEIPGQSHWYDLADEPGADAVDYVGLFDFLARHARPSSREVREVDFSTFNPGVSAGCYWATVESQEKVLALSRVVLRLDPYKRRIAGTTENVKRLTLDLVGLEPADGKGVRLELDGQSLDVAEAKGKLTILKEDGKWAVSQPAPPTWKNPARSGPFRLAFGERMVFVYGTGGTPEENAWAFQKARYDAELFWYRGNGSVDVVPDREFDPKEKDRSVILYGNADTNRAWPPLLSDSPVTVHRGSVGIGERKIEGDDLACLFLRPRKGSEKAYVAAVAWTGMAGGRTANGLNTLQPMLGFPDVFVAGAEALTKGGEGIRAAGYFGEDWSVERGEFAFR